MHHAYVICSETKEGIAIAYEHIEKLLRLVVHANPDVVTLEFGLLSVEDARRVATIAAQAPVGGNQKAIVIAATRVYHEAQNALLKIFEEPPRGLTLFLILPTPGGLLPTLRSRVQILGSENPAAEISEDAVAFLKANKEKRSALIKKLSTGKDELERRENREKVIGILNGIERVAYRKGIRGGEAAAFFSDIAELRTHLYDRAAPVRMILEHLSLAIPKDLVL